MADRGRYEQLGWFVLASVPVLTVLVTLAFAYDTSRATGAWPTYGSPDPKTTGSWMYDASLIGLPGSFAAVAALFIALPVVRRLRFGRRDVAALSLAAAGIAVLMYLWTGNLGDWLAD